MLTTNPLIKAQLAGVVINTGIGIHEHERGRKQRLRIDCEIDFRPNQWPAQSINDVYDYDALHAYITDTVPNGPHIDLIETLLSDLLAFIWSDERVSQVRIRLAKPDVFPNASGAGIETALGRNDWLAMQSAKA